MEPQKAIITVESAAVDDKGGLPATLTVQFNPTEYTLTKAAQVAEIAIPGIDSPILQFVRGQTETLQFDLFFDVTTHRGAGPEATDVRKVTEQFYKLAHISKKTHALPRITFSWGQGLSFKAIVDSVTQKFTLFDQQGIPLRATLTVSFKRYEILEDQLKRLNLMSSDHTKRRVVTRGDTLSSIAAQEYGDPSEWRLLADANPEAAANPRRPKPGLVLEIPPKDLPTGRSAQ